MALRSKQQRPMTWNEKRRGRTPDYKYPTICDVLENKCPTNCNMYGVVFDFKTPTQSRGSDFFALIIIVDPTATKPLKIRLFHRDVSYFPEVKCGDIIRIHRLKLYNQHGVVSLTSTKGWSWVLWKYKVATAMNLVQSMNFYYAERVGPLFASTDRFLAVTQTDIDNPVKKALSGSESYTLLKSDEDMVDKLREWQKKYPNIAEDWSFQRQMSISEINADDYCIVYCQIINMVDDGSCCYARVWDGTKPSIDFHRHPLDGTNEASKLGVPEGYSVDVVVAAGHYADMKSLGVCKGDFVVFYGLHAFPNRPPNWNGIDVTPSELCLYSGNSNGRRVAIASQNEHYDRLERATRALANTFPYPLHHLGTFGRRYRLVMMSPIFIAHAKALHQTDGCQSQEPNTLDLMNGLEDQSQSPKRLRLSEENHNTSYIEDNGTGDGGSELLQGGVDISSEHVALHNQNLNESDKNCSEPNLPEGEANENGVDPSPQNDQDGRLDRSTTEDNQSGDCQHQEPNTLDLMNELDNQPQLSEENNISTGDSGSGLLQGTSQTDARKEACEDSVTEVCGDGLPAEISSLSTMLNADVPLSKSKLFRVKIKMLAVNSSKNAWVGHYSPNTTIFFPSQNNGMHLKITSSVEKFVTHWRQVSGKNENLGSEQLVDSESQPASQWQIPSHDGNTTPVGTVHYENEKDGSIWKSMNMDGFIVRKWRLGNEKFSILYILKPDDFTAKELLKYKLNYDRVVRVLPLGVLVSNAPPAVGIQDDVFYYCCPANATLPAVPSLKEEAHGFKRSHISKAAGSPVLVPRYDMTFRVQDDTGVLNRLAVNGKSAVKFFWGITPQVYLAKVEHYANLLSSNLDDLIQNGHPMECIIEKKSRKDIHDPTKRVYLYEIVHTSLKKQILET